MKPSMLIPSAILASISFAAIGGDKVIKLIPSEGCSIPVKTIDVAKMPAYEDVLDFGSGECNWGGPVAVGTTVNGDSIYVGYDYNLLVHRVLVGDSLIAHDISLIFSDIDSKANTATISRGPHKTKKISFSDPEFPQILRDFLSPPQGYHRESYSYGLNSYNGDQYLLMPQRRTFTAELPDDASARRSILRMMPEMYFDGISTGIEGDTIIYVEREINNLKDYTERSAEQLAVAYKMANNTVTPLSPFTLQNPMETFTDVVQFLPVCETPSYLSLLATVNSVYPAGGGRSSSTGYTTFSKKDCRPLSSADLFEPKKLNAVKTAFINAVSQQMIAENMIYSDGEDVQSLYSPAAILDAFLNDEWKGTEESGPFSTDINAMTLPEMAAITPEGIIFSYPGEIFTMFGETGLFTQLVPWKEISSALKPNIRKEIASIKAL